MTTFFGVGMKIRTIIVALGLAATTVLTLPIHAQVVRPGTALEVITPKGTIRGDARATTPTSLILGDADTIPLASVTSWRSRSTYARTGLKSGAIAGGVVFTLFGAALGAVLCESSNCEHAWVSGATVGALFGVVAVGAGGAIVGSLVPRWVEHPRGSTPSVKESALATQPVGLYVSQGLRSDDGSVTQGGIQLRRGEWRVGVERGTAGLVSTRTSTFQSATDPRLRTFTDVSRNSDWFGVAAERRIAGPLWLTAATSKRWRRETIRIADLGSADDPRYPQVTNTETITNRSSLGGSLGAAVRHRVFDDIYLRLDARQEFGAWATRTWSVGVEL
jgi:hypothetical protein